MSARRLILILGDQLTHGLGALKDIDREHDHVLLAEVMEEASHVPHHPKKIALIFSAMRHFSEALRARGIQVHYVTLDDPDNSGSLAGELLRWTQRLDPAEVHLTECGDWRLEQALRHCGVPIHWHQDSRFLCSRDAFAAWAKGRKQLRMEFFYREMRRDSGLLLNPDGTPEGGAWNFDADNRKALPKGVRPPAALRIEPDAITAEVLALVARRFTHHYGRLDGFDYPVTAEQAERLWQHFLARGLADFGDYQDAMVDDEPFLFHSRISAALNIGLLDMRQLLSLIHI